MEAVPRLPMMSFDLKSSPEPTSFGPKLKQYIRDFYHEDPESYSSEMHTLEGLRAAAVCAVKDVSGVSTLKRYYCQLHFLQSRFPMSKDGAAAVSFTWRDTYASMVCTSTDIRFEMVCILYNIGALHTQLGALDTRVSAEGMKMSCTHFQCAAWAFEHLKGSYPQPAGVDLAPDIMQFMYYLSLAQAQECILEKSMMDNRKPTIIAKVAVQIVDYYSSALNTLEQGGADDCSIAETVGSKIYKNWKRYVKFKMVYHTCISLLYRGQQAEEQQKMGERVTFYQAAAEKLEEAVKLSKGMDNIDAINEALTFTNDVVEGKKKAAKNENEFIYHEEVPPLDILPEVKGASLVKGIMFNVNDPEVAGADIFARLVPMKAHEASSLYSEEKAKLLRKVGTKIDEKDQELDVFMASLQLDYLKLHSEPESLPQELVDRCAAFSAKPDAIQNLIDSMNKLADTYQDVEAMLQDVKELLELEDKKEKEYQELMGKRPPSIVATDLTREANKYHEAHAKASESNQTLHKAMTLHISNLRILSLPLPDLKKQIPTISNMNTPEDEASIKELQHLIDKVDEMKKQRATLAAQLRESVCQDDITRQLVTRTGESLETIFSQEMQKHQKYETIIEQNLAAQENILKALTEAYAKCAGPRKAAMDTIRKREATINALISSYDAYEDLLAKSNKGLEFYRKLETNVTKLLQRVKGTCKVQDEEREQILAKNNKKIPRQDIEKPSIDSGGPKLRDYLQSMKGTLPTGSYSTSQIFTLPSSTAMPASSTTGIGGQLPASYTAESAGSSENLAGPLPWVPPVRPAPVGSEGTTETCGTITKQDTLYQPTTSPGIAKPEMSHQTPAYVSSAPQYTYSTSGYQPPHQMPYTGDQYTDYAYGQTQQYYQHQTTGSHVFPPTSSTPRGPGSYSSVGSRDTTRHHAAKSAAYQYGSAYHGTDTVQNPYSHLQTPPISQAQSTNVPQPQIGDTSEMYAGYPQHYHTQVHQNYSTSQQAYLPQTVPTTVHSTVPQQTSTSGIPAMDTTNEGGVSQSSISSAAQHSTTPQYRSTPQHDTAVQQQQLSYPAHSTSYPTYDYSKSQSYQYGAAYAAQDSSVNVPYYSGNTQQQAAQCGWQENQQTLMGSYDTEHKIPPHPQSYPSVQKPPVIYPQYQWQQAQSQTQQLQNQNVSSYSASSSDVGPTSSAVQYQGAGAAPSGSTSSLQTQPSSMPQQQPYYDSMYSTVYAASPPYSVQASVASSSNIVDATQYQYMAGAGTSSYTNAGKYATSQTSSFQTAVDGQTYASQYNTTLPISSQAYSHVNYYTAPYGYQYGSETIQSESQPTVQNDTYQQGTSAQQAAAPSPMTYMQARFPGDATNTTFSLQGSSSSSSVGGKSDSGVSSNIDLLAGLDFSLNQKPLVPQQPANVSPKKEQQVQQNGVAKQQTGSSVQQTDGSNFSPKKEIVAQQPSVTMLQTQISSVVNEASGAGEKKPPVLPTIQVPEQNEVSAEDRQTSKTLEKDPFADPEVLNQFVLEVEKYEKFVEGLTTKTLNGPTPLDMKWKELLELQEKDAHKRSISVARCYPMKNRFPDILPYDHSRVELPSTKDDYINASFVKDLTPNTPSFIATQAPLPSTHADFWMMVWEQQVEVVVCLLSDTELEGQIYWPQEKGSELTMGKMKLSLQSCNVRPNWIERIISVSLGETRARRVIVHLQFTAWPGSSFPASPGPFLSFVSETLSLYKQQRNTAHPVVVHCLSGVGRTGLFCLVCAAVCEVRAGHGLLDLVATTAIMSTNRKGSLRDREHLKFAYQSVLYYAQDLLMKRGILTSCSTFEDKRSRGGKCHTRHPSEDFLLGPPTALSQLQSGLEKMGLDAAKQQQETELNENPYVAERKVPLSSAGSSVDNSCSSSGRTSPLVSSPSPSSTPFFLIDPARFNLKPDASGTKMRRRYSRENFKVKSKDVTELDIGKDMSDDPLSKIDPLWPLKRQ
ncbi:tyrosine-protein phosphatase non-receptor type 23 isoform X1 [Schistocerca nitens]|uniref:tyrosine-protein phosphatase non-receptor type 23 isoform X1 n=1 Tax=Schistocerca nitens TaxID=7011 RepID=UPI00211748FB|nr:tyrosine-protein phosphatase non-receptor type 23 isoform X1 [Schistocerca nitens]